MTIARVFPFSTRVRAMPDDPLAHWNPRELSPPVADEVHLSVTFSWHLPKMQRLYEVWKAMGVPVKIGGPATGMRGEAFTPGLYLRRGYVITSRGCDNRCAHCRVWIRDGVVRELPIEEGNDVLDDNILACSPRHILSVLDMLRRQRLGRPQFTGGLEAKRFEPWVAEAIRSVNPVQVFFAYDEPADWEPLVRAADLCRQYKYSLKGHHVRAYVLCGYRADDTLAAAEQRMRAVMGLGIVPMAMVWRGNSGVRKPEWVSFQRRWARVAIMCSTS